MPVISVADLDDFIDVVDKKYGGNLLHPEVVSRFYPMQLDLKTEVDQTLDPFSEHYFSQQLAVYEEVSGRKLNQWDGELHPVDIARLLAAKNPLGINNVTHVSEHVRALSSMLSISGLKDNAKILDMGAGHGLSSEVFAFCGSQVHAIDIDPLLAELSIKRSSARNLGITRTLLNFDDAERIADDNYDAAYFFQSLHHCLRPWKLIEAMSKKMSATGVIGFTGEPIQSNHWKNWGLRLDHESLYVARKHGWFESGWSHDFIAKCFTNSGMFIKFFDGGHGGGEIGIAAKNEQRLLEVTQRAKSLGFSEIIPNDFERIADHKYHSEIGIRTSLMGRPAYTTKLSHHGGYLCYGPYIKLKSGDYHVQFILEQSSINEIFPEGSSVYLDVCGNGCKDQYFNEEIQLKKNDVPVIVDRMFYLSGDIDDVEARILVLGGDKWSCSYPTFRVRKL